MPTTNDNFKNKIDDGLNQGEQKIKVNHEDSSLVQFTKRALPNEKQLESFEEYVEEEAKEEEIDESLNEIYQDDKGRMVDVKRLDRRKKHGFLFWFLAMVFVFSFLAGGGYFAYYYYLQFNSDITAVDFKIESKNEVLTSEEFVYTLTYKNNSNIDAKNGRIEAIYPANFIFIDSTPAPTEKNSIWLLGEMGAQAGGEIKVKGKIIAPAETINVILANLTYMPVNFSSEFKKEASQTTYVKNTGVNFDFDYFSSSLVGEENDINLKFAASDVNFLNSFRVSLLPQENIVFIGDSKEKVASDTPFTQVRPGVWEVNQVTTEATVLPIKFKFNKKLTDKQTVAVVFEQSSGDKFYKFLEKNFDYEVMKSDLNLTLINNGSREDSGIDFGQTLNYSIVYKNKGETVMKDVVIMAVLESDWLDWSSLSDKQDGIDKANTISWSKDEIPALAELAKDQEDTIDFSIKVTSAGVIDPTKNYEVKSYAQFSVGNKGEIKDTLDNRSNTITNKIKSDLKLDEQVRYFSADNIPVGIGPNPPKSEEKTSFKVYWKLTNSLNELQALEVRVKLPTYASFEGRNQATVGTVYYDSGSGEVVWQIGRLPVTTYQANAEFSVGITPTASDRNKILIILPGSKTTGIDTTSNANLEYLTKAKTTKLEDDEIGSSDGIVQ